MTQHNTSVAAIVLAGGKGTRLHNDGETQKVLCKVGGKSLIQHTMDILDPQFVRRVVFNVGYQAEKVQKWVEAQRFPHYIAFSRQTQWSIYNAIMRALSLTREETIICCNADEVRIGLNLGEVLEFHKQQNTLCTMVATYRDHLYRHRMLTVRAEDMVLLSSEYNPERFRAIPELRGLVHAGFAVFRREAAAYFNKDDTSRGWNALINPLCDARMISVFIPPALTHFNVNTPEELTDALTFFSD